MADVILFFHSLVLWIRFNITLYRKRHRLCGTAGILILFGLGSTVSSIEVDVLISECLFSERAEFFALFYRLFHDSDRLDLARDSVLQVESCQRLDDNPLESTSRILSSLPTSSLRSRILFSVFASTFPVRRLKGLFLLPSMQDMCQRIPNIFAARRIRSWTSFLSLLSSCASRLLTFLLTDSSVS